MAEAAISVLAKKISAIQARGYAFPVLQALARRLETAAARAGGELLRAAVETAVERSLVGRVANVVALLPEQGLVNALTRPGGGTGIAVFDAALMDHVVDILMGGDPNRARERPPRPPTAIDGRLCARLGSRLLAQFDDELRSLADGVGLGPIRWQPAPVALEEVRTALGERQYLIFSLTFDIGSAGRSGSLLLVLPLAAVEPVASVLRDSAVIRTEDDSEDWARHMRRVVAATPLRLEAVIERRAVPVAELTRLEVGQVLELPDVTLDDVTLELASGGMRRRLGRGRLGSFRQNKALKIIEPPDAAFLAPLAEQLGIEPAELPGDAEELPPPSIPSRSDSPRNGGAGVPHASGPSGGAGMGRARGAHPSAGRGRGGAAPPPPRSAPGSGAGDGG